MATTSLTLSLHWEIFIRDEVASGRFSSASEVVRAALRELEDKGKRLEALRAHLAEGESEARLGAFAEGFSMEALIGQARANTTETEA
ncbi:MAG: type II toxin-antitoxin system ParD family antitoxin [Paracoccaceae bacterium]